MMPTGFEHTELLKRPRYECPPKVRQDGGPGGKHQAGSMHRVPEKRDKKMIDFTWSFLVSVIRHRKLVSPVKYIDIDNVA